MIINPNKTHKSAINRFKTLEEEYDKIHNNKYDYSRAVYNGDGEKITIICPVHGDFEQRAGEHLRYGCHQCSVEFRGKKLSLGVDEVITRCIDTHGDKFDYSNIVYKNSSSPLEIKCIKHGYVFTQTYHEHIKSKYACPVCKSEATYYDIYKNKPTILYVVKINDVLYKIGITQSSVNTRYYKELKNGVKIELLYEKLFQDGFEAYSKEQEVLRSTFNFTVDKIQSPLVSGGYTELRSVDLFTCIQQFSWFEI